MVAPNTIENPSGTSAPTTDIYAATRVVSLAGDGTDLTIAAAIAALPVLGGTIFIKQGVYPQALNIPLPDKQIRFVGAGSGFDGAPSTVLDLGANLITLFSRSFKKKVRFEHLNVIGNGTVGQAFIQNDVGTEEYIECEDVHVRDIQSCFPHTAPHSVRLTQFKYEPSLAFAAQFWSFLGGFGGNSFIWMDQVIVRVATIDDNPIVYATNCDLALGTIGVPTINSLQSLRAAACEFSGGQIALLDARIVGCKFTTGIFGAPPVRYLDILAPGGQVVQGCKFESMGTSEEIRLETLDALIDCVGTDFQIKVTEVGISDKNHYRNISYTSTIIGPKSTVENDNVQSFVANVTLDETHRTVEMSAAGGARTISLPTASSAIHRKYTIKKMDATANTVTVDAAGAETIDGALTVVLGTQYATITIQSDGTQWIIIAEEGVGGVDIFAASRIVSLVPGEGTDLTIAAAIAALPAAGGDIYVKGGVYPIAATLAFGTKVVRLRGAGTSVDFTTGPVTLVPGAGVTVFSGGAKGSSIEDITIEGDNASSQVLYSGGDEVRFSRINVHDVAGIIVGTPEVTFRDSFINVPSGVTIPLADRFVWKGLAAGGTLIWDNVEVFISGGGATLMSGVTAGANGPTFKVVNSYTGGGGGGGSTNFWFAQVIDWVSFDIDNAQFQISGARNNVVNSNFLDFSIKFKGVWNFISNSNFSQGGTDGAFFDAQLTFEPTTPAIPQQNTVTGCNFYGNSSSLNGIKATGVQEMAISGCNFSNHTTNAINLVSACLNIEITGSTFTHPLGGGTRFIDIASTPTLSGRVTVVGNTFDGSLLAVRNAGVRCVVADNVLCSVTEVGSANNNLYDNNTDFTPSGIIGGASRIDGNNVTNTAVDLTLTDDHRTVTVNASGAARTITLPTAASAKWRKYIVKKTDATVNGVTIDASGAETIDGSLTYVLTAQYQSIEIQSDGTTWWII